MDKDKCFIVIRGIVLTLTLISILGIMMLIDKETTIKVVDCTGTQVSANN